METLDLTPCVNEMVGTVSHTGGLLTAELGIAGAGPGVVSVAAPHPPIAKAAAVVVSTFKNARRSEQHAVLTLQIPLFFM
jgi:hypothetical protein